MKAINILWQLPQYLISLLILGYYKAKGKIECKVCVTGGIAGHSCVYFLKSNQRKAFSMGELIFLYNGYSEQASSQNRRKEVIKHEYGYAIWSVYLGWFYLLLIGIPSLIITGISPNLAEKCYFERWANNSIKDIELIFLD
ncbi:MAG TPA: hypothetical protein DEQ30_03010 [Porphyromonadaceae bacterium]|nr:hypothetical protein [Porphyromonadaceae bacterium]